MDFVFFKDQIHSSTIPILKSYSMGPLKECMTYDVYWYALSSKHVIQSHFTFSHTGEINAYYLEISIIPYV